MTEIYSLDGHLDSAAGPKLAAEILEKRGSPLKVDAQNVSFAGTLALQVLVAARRQWQEDGHDFSLGPVSAAMAASASSVGIDLTAIGARDADVLDLEDAQ